MFKSSLIESERRSDSYYFTDLCEDTLSRWEVDTDTRTPHTYSFSISFLCLNATIICNNVQHLALME